MLSNDTVIALEGISKRYYLRAQRPEDIKTTVLHLPSFLKRGNAGQAFWALDEVSFSVKRGESMGVIGPNGSGKSTLLKIMADLAPPTRGKVEVAGRISALLELGAGFHPQITGRENAILNAVLLGLTRKEAQEALPDIIAFSELGNFIDEPMRTYSSGMYVRLGFSVAVHVTPDVLLVDEVLAVGDARVPAEVLRPHREAAGKRRHNRLRLARPGQRDALLRPRDPAASRPDAGRGRVAAGSPRVSVQDCGCVEACSIILATGGSRDDSSGV